MSPDVRARRRRVALRVAGAGAAWSLGLLLTALLTPLYHGQTTADANGLTLSTATYVQRSGAWVLIPLALPLIASVVTVLAVVRADPRLRGTAGAVTASVAILGLVLVASGGILLLATAITLGVALRLTRAAVSGPGRARSRRPGRPAARAESPTAPPAES